MTLPGVAVQIADTPAQRLAARSTANWFVGGYAKRGPANTPVLVRSIGAFESYFGPRDPAASLYDALDVFFREGGRAAYVSRIVGPAVATSSGDLDDSSAPTLHVEASSAGDWGDSIDVVVATDSATFIITVKYSNVVVETSPALADVAEAVAWAAASSAYIRLTDVGGSDDPVDQTVSLTGGDEDRDGVTDTEIAAAIAAFTADYGPGQVSLPGFTTSSAFEALLAHAYAFKRIAKLDAEDTTALVTLTPAATGLRTIDGHTLAAMFAPWDTCPGVVAGTERVVPPSARNAALHARALMNGLSTGDPAAGSKLPALYVHGLSQVAWSDTDRETLNDAGVNVSRVVRDEVVTYGNRTLTSALTEPNWAQLSQSTVIAAIANRGAEIAEAHVHDKVDGAGVNVGKFIGELQGMCLDEFYRPGDLYGDSPADAFTITPAVDIQDATATVLATIEARVSPGADRIEISIVKTPIS